MVVGGAYLTLVLIPTAISVFGHDIVWIIGWRDLLSVALAVGGGRICWGFLTIFLIFLLRVRIFELTN